MVEICIYIFICFYIGFTQSKNSHNVALCSIVRKHDSAMYIELYIFRFPLEKTDDSEAMDSQLWAGRLEDHDIY